MTDLSGMLQVSRCTIKYFVTHRGASVSVNFAMLGLHMLMQAEPL